jgi:hypothetical protein
MRLFVVGFTVAAVAADVEQHAHLLRSVCGLYCVVQGGCTCFRRVLGTRYNAHSHH